MFPIGDTIPRRNVPIATWLLILINCLVFLFETAMPEHTLESFFYLFGIVPARYTHPNWALWIGLPIDDYWPFLTSLWMFFLFSALQPALKQRFLDASRQLGSLVGDRME